MPQLLISEPKGSRTLPFGSLGSPRGGSMERWLRERSADVVRRRDPCLARATLSARFRSSFARFCPQGPGLADVLGDQDGSRSGDVGGR